MRILVDGEEMMVGETRVINEVHTNMRLKDDIKLNHNKWDRICVTLNSGVEKYMFAWQALKLIEAGVLENYKIKIVTRIRRNW